MASQTNPWTELRRGTPEMEAALSACPEEVRMMVKRQRPQLRGAPPKLVGRTEVFEEIRTSVLAVTNAAEGTESIRATALVAPPGAGKTAVLSTLRDQLREDGVNVLELRADQLISPQAFSDAVRDSPPWNRRDFWNRLGKAAITGVAVTADDIIALLTTLGLKFIAKSIGDADAGPIQAALQAWREHRTPNMKDVLVLMRAGSDKGVVILIDEAQELVQYQKDTPEHRNASTVLRLINDPSIRTTSRLWNVTFVAAGMQDTADIVHAFTTVPPDPIPLGPVDMDTAHTMIEERIHASTATADDKVSAIAAWAEPLARRYGDWTRHARCAGEAARVVLSHAKTQALTESWGVPLLLDNADRYQIKLYEEIIERAHQNDVSWDVQFTVIEALARNGRSLPERGMRRLVGVCVREVAEDLGTQPAIEELEKMVNEKIRNLKRAGLIGEDDGSYRSPIPSIVQYMTENRKAELNEILRRIEEAGLSTDPPQA